MLKNLLVVTYSFPPYIGCPTIRVSKITKYLPRYGWLPIVLTVSEKYYPDYINENKDNSLCVGFDKRIKVIRTKVLKNRYIINLENRFLDGCEDNRDGSFLGRNLRKAIKKITKFILIPDMYILWLPYAVVEGIKIIKNTKVDLIFATTPPHSVGIISFLISKISKIPVILDVKDDWVGNAIYEDKNFFLKKVDKWLEKKILSHAVSILLVTKESIKLCKRKHPYLNFDKLFLIPNGFDPEDFAKYDNNFFKRNKKSKILISYFGNLNIKRDLTVFLKVLKQKSFKEKYKLHLYGLIHGKYKEAIKIMGLNETVKCFGYINHDQALDFMVKSDVCLVIITEEEGSRTAIPGKLYEHVRGGKPILTLTDKNSASAKFIRKNKLGWVCHHRDEKEITQALNEIIIKHKKDELQINANNRVLDSYDRRKNTAKLAELLSKICEKKG